MAESGLDSGLNISRGIGDGKANVLDFRPVIKATENMLLREEQQRRFAQKQYDDIVKTYEVGRQKLRAPDVDKYVDLYNNYKALNQAKLSGRLKDPKELARIDQEINNLGGSMQQLVAKSAQQAEFETKLADDNLRRFDDYQENTPAIIAAMRQTPTEEIENNSLRGIGVLPTNVRDLSTYLAPQFDPKAIQHWGKSKRGLPKVEKLPNGSFREVFTTELELQPEQIIQQSHDLFLSQKDAQREFKKVFKGDMESGAYKMVVEEAAKKFPELAGKPIVDPATYFAVKHLATFKPEVTYGEPKFTDAKKEQNMRDRMGLGQYYRKAFLDYKNEQDEKKQHSIVQSYLRESYNSGEKRSIYYKGSKIDGRLTVMPKEISIKYGRKIKGGDGVEKILEPDFFLMSDDQKTFIPLFKTKDRTSNSFEVEKTKPYPMANLIADLAKAWRTKTEFDDEMIGEDAAEIDDDIDGNAPVKTKTNTKGGTKPKKKIDW